MSDAIHPAAAGRVPFFVPGPDGSDPLLVATTWFLVAAVLAFGLLFLRLHTLPERMAHRSKKVQFEIVAVLGLLALFTHMHIFWVAGLLLALIDLPDFGNPLRRMAGSLEKLAGVPPGAGDTLPTPDATPDHGEVESREADVPPAPAPKAPAKLPLAEPVAAEKVA